MQPNQPPFSTLRAFDAVGSLGGIRRAAAALGVSHAIVSRHLRALEEHVGAALFDRQKGRLTAAGGAYHARLSGALSEIREATAAVQGSRAGPIVVGCAPGLALHWLTGRLSGFASNAAAPLIELRALDAPPSLLDDDIDADIRYVRDGEASEERHVRVLDLARPPVIPVASPDLADRLRPRLQLVSDLLGAPLIEEQGPMEWKLWFAAQNLDFYPQRIAARYGHAHLALAGARAGQGVALGNHYLMAEDLAAGRLVPLCFSEAEPALPPLGTYAFRANRNLWDNPRLARFRGWLVREFSRGLP